MSRANLKHKFIIGTANFTQTYGANPTNVSKNEIIKILHLAKKHKINKIDTAEAYLKTNYNFKKIEKTFKWTSLEFCQKKLQNHIKSFSGKQLETLLFHDTKILFTQKGDKIFKNLELLKSKKYFHKIGLAIYDTNYLSTLIN